MSTPLDRLSIHGFKSIQDLERFELSNLNILIGANGAGKSNFVDFFRMLRAMSIEGLASFVRVSGGADGFFFGGPKTTPIITALLEFGKSRYRFSLGSTPRSELTVRHEYFDESKPWGTPGSTTIHDGGRPEALLANWRNQHFPDLTMKARIAAVIADWTVYHFHDTTYLAGMRRDQPTSNGRVLESDAGNIAPFLYRMSGAKSAPTEDGAMAQTYRRIREVIQLVAPFFDDFLWEPEMKGPSEVIRLQWKQKGSGFPFQPWQLSDGTIRFACLATALLQPDSHLPSTIIIDEPELGLHPSALDLLASLIKEAATRTQLIVSTQSPTFLNAFAPEDVVVVDRVGGASRLRRLETAPLANWLEEYTLGDLVEKNVIEAGPSYA